VNSYPLVLGRGRIILSQHKGAKEVLLCRGGGKGGHPLGVVKKGNIPPLVLMREELTNLQCKDIIKVEMRRWYLKKKRSVASFSLGKGGGGTFPSREKKLLDFALERKKEG